MKTMKSYSELITLNTFDERCNYLKIKGNIGDATFGGYRNLSQSIYKNNDEWRRVRNRVIVRDNGCDLAMPDRSIIGDGDYENSLVYRPKIIIHHINPLTVDDVLYRPYLIYDMDNLVCTSFNTHNCINYGKDLDTIFDPLITRRPNDTAPWR